MAHAGRVELTEEERTRLEEMARSRTLAARKVLRAKIILRRANGESFRDIGMALGCDHRTAWKCANRWAVAGFEGIEKEQAGRGRKSWVIAVKGQEIIQRTTQETPANATHWSRATMAQAAGVSESTVGRIWKQNGLKPHRVVGFKISNDPRFEEKLVDVVALYLDPPEHAIVLSVDEKSQIQALDRTQPGLPMKKGRCGTMTHDYKRNGTTTLFAALNTLDGTVISETMPRHRHHEWLRFMKRLHRATPKHLALHIICDNYATHKHPAVKAWLETHTRVHVHFTPTSASWLNMVERFFRDITENRIRRGVFKSVPELEAAIHTYIENHNAAPKPFIWTAAANDILAKVARARKALNVARISGDLHYLHARRFTRKVTGDCRVEFETNRYSVPFHLVGRTVDMEVEGGELTVRWAGKVVAEHGIAQGRHRDIQDPGHVEGLVRRTHKTLHPCELQRPLSDYEAVVGSERW